MEFILDSCFLVPNHGSEGNKDPPAAEARERGQPDRDLQNQRWVPTKRPLFPVGRGLTVSASRSSTATLYNRYKGSIYLVFDFCEHDLAGLLSNSNVKFTLAEIKKVMQMLLNGLYYIHRNKVLSVQMCPPL